jgi:5-methyltetrahydropteroyltriglutamate--homocysteine methyltransferase
METSRDRMICTHVGSLPRPPELLAALRARERAEGEDDAAWNARVAAAVDEAVRRQAELGIDVVTDGELGKPSFMTYVNDRLAGLEPRELAGVQWTTTRDAQDFPEYYEWAGKAMPSPAAGAPHYVCTGPISYTGHEQLRTQLETLRVALDRVDVVEAFVPAISPANVEGWNGNEHYASQEDFLEAIAEALREEYEAIVAAGFVLQVDDPALVTRYMAHPDESVEDVRTWAHVRVDALNHALRNVPRDRVRFHTCYSINIGPRLHDMELKDVVDIILSVRAGAYSFEAANPRHEHEWRVWADVTLPEDTILIPGVITNSSVLVEHPELVAERIERFARVVGAENVIAGADCGFATFAGSPDIHGSIAWAKLAALAEGTRIASGRLFR